MAVSQFLRPGSLMDAVKSYLTPDMVGGASALVGESESSTRRTLDSAVPSVFSGLTRMVSSREGVVSLGALIRDGGFGSAVDNVSSLFSGGSTTNSMLAAGQQVIDRVFIGKASSVAGLLARSHGVTSSSANTLLSLAASLIIGVLGKRAAAKGLDSNGLANALLSEKSDIAPAAPAELSQILSGGPSVVSRTPEAVAEARREPSVDRSHTDSRGPGLGRWILLLLITLGVLALVSFIRPRTLRGVDNALDQFLRGGSQATPKTFALDDLHFDAGSAQLTSDSAQTVNHLAQVLKTYPNAQVQLVEHTDNTGSAEASRLDVVKAMLVSQGVSAERISTRAFGQDRPVVSNDTEDLRLESHGPDGDFASSLSATLDRANAEQSSQDRSVASNDTEDLRLESHGPDGDFASSLSATLDRAQNPRIELIVVSK